MKSVEKAFPAPYWNGERMGYLNEGMTLRQYIAIAAMQALIAKGMDNSNNRNAKGVPVIAKFAYEYADAMLQQDAA